MLLILLRESMHGTLKLATIALSQVSPQSPLTISASFISQKTNSSLITSPFHDASLKRKGKNAF
jgi:hypothetical protein